MIGQAVLIVENLSVDILRTGQRLPVLRNIHLTVQAGEIHALIGASGSGKSTLVMIISGILPRDQYDVRSGHIWLEGKEGRMDLLTLDWVARQQLTGHRINMIYQEPSTAFNPVHTVGDQLMETAQKPLGKDVLQAQAASLGLDAEDLWDRYPWQLSGGQQQRFLLARALTMHPDLILADEPTSALDHHHQQEFLRDLKTSVARAGGAGVLLVSHDRSLVSQIADQVTEIKDGEIRNSDIQLGREEVTPPGRISEKGYSGSGVRQIPTLDPLLTIHHLTAGYTTGVSILKDIEMKVHSGELIGIAGSSGSGKSSLLRGILGLMPWQMGSVEPGTSLVKGVQDVQLVYQDPGRSLNPVMTMQQTMREWAEATGPEAMDELPRILQEVGLESEMLDRLPHMFSGGQRQRMAIARALLTQPGILFADEPFSNLDAPLRDQMMQLFQNLARQRHMGIVVVAHDLPRLERYCDRILLLQDGQIRWEGPADQLEEQSDKWILELRALPNG